MGDVETVQVVDGVQQLQHHPAGVQLCVAKLVRYHDRIVQISALQRASSCQPRHRQVLIIVNRDVG